MLPALGHSSITYKIQFQLRLLMPEAVGFSCGFFLVSHSTKFLLGITRPHANVGFDQ